MTDAVGGASRYLDTEGVYARVETQLGRASDWALSPHRDGLGNETLFLNWGRRRFVLKRPPLEERARASHDILREYAILRGLDRAVLPTPRPILACRDASVAGASFTVQERLDGDVLRHGEPAGYATGAYRQRVAEELVDTLAELHAIDWRIDDLAGVERRTPADRVEVWRDRFDQYRAATGRDVRGADAVARQLVERAPEPEEATLVHGDYTLANVTFSRDGPPELVGVLDWERTRIGDPRADLGRLTAFWFEDEAERVGLPPVVQPGFTTRAGYPDRTALVEGYESRTGRSFDHDRFHRAMAVYETAAVCEGYYLRHLLGQSDHAAFAALEDAVPALIERAGRILDGEEPL